MSGTVCAATLTVLLSAATGNAQATDVELTLSPYMNAIPPSQDYLCVGTGAEDRALHPDRAPHTVLAQQDGVILFSGTAPQQGLNFSLRAGALVYRNQMSTLGGPEPSPQLGAAGTLKQKPWEFTLPWSEARWHPGEDIVWQGHRTTAPSHLWGMAYWDYELDTSDYPKLGAGADPNPDGVFQPVATGLGDGSSWGLDSAVSLQFARGIYQVSKVRGGFLPTAVDLAPERFREPWFHGVGRNVAFNVALDMNLDGTVEVDPIDRQDTERLAAHCFPTFHNIYTFEQLDLDAGRLVLDFERSATWPRRDREVEVGENDFIRRREIVGTELAGAASDRYGNRVVFDRVPNYGWETDYKYPSDVSSSGPLIPQGYESQSHAWKLPHKRLRSVELYSAKDLQDNLNPEWTVVFVHEHPESDRISATDTGEAVAGDKDTVIGRYHIARWGQWKSLYSHLPQAEWSIGRLPELNDETTLLTVQTYRREAWGVEGWKQVNGPEFQDDYSVWGSDIGYDNIGVRARVNKGIEYLKNAAGVEVHDRNEDGCPGICGVDDDGDGLIDEHCGFGSGICGGGKVLSGGFPEYDCMGRWPTGNETFGYTPSENEYGYGCVAADIYMWDDNEDGLVEYKAEHNAAVSGTSCSDYGWHGVTDPARLGPARGSDEGDASGQAPTCPGLCCIDDDGDGLIDENSDQVVTTQAIPNSDYALDYFARYDDDEDAIFDEDGKDNPFLVNLRAAAGECASGRFPFVPPSTKNAPAAHQALLPGDGDADRCRPAIEASGDPWVHQVQYVYARSNPYWLLVERNAEPDPTNAAFGTPTVLSKPKYYYFPPFSADINGDGNNSLFYDRNGNGLCDSADDDVMESFFCGTSKCTTGLDEPFAACVVEESSQSFDVPNEPNEANVHPDCLPNPKFRGPRGERAVIPGAPEAVDASAPSDVHLIKRIVRVRPDSTDPSNYIEQVWLYRYNDFGFLKAVFDPASVQALIEADSDIVNADDILKYSDMHAVGGKPLINYASQWYTYYNPRINDAPVPDEGLPMCYAEPPYIGPSSEAVAECLPLSPPIDLNNPFHYLPENACDGYDWWTIQYSEELHADPDCSDLLRDDCGWCLSRWRCGENTACDDPECTCYGGYAENQTVLRQLGVSDAQPRFRKYMIKTARTRGADGEMHLYRFDYLGAASGVYADDAHIQSYQDPHNITIVDELVEQTDCEFNPTDPICNPEDGPSDFYIYEDDFKLVLDPADREPTPFVGADRYEASSHYLKIPVKVKTRRVVVMNFYGIALSDRLILTPGYDGIQTHLIDDQRYELVNRRGQSPHVYDESWVAGLREMGAGYVKSTGRVITQLFGGQGGWHSVLRGVAKGSAGGNVYSQQCRTPEVLEEVPVQRVRPEQLDIMSVTQHLDRCPDGPGCAEPVKDLPEVEAHYYSAIKGNDFSFSPNDCTDCIHDPTGLIGYAYCSGTADASCNPETDPECYEGAEGTQAYDYLTGIDLRNDNPVTVKQIPSPNSPVGGEGEEGDGVSKVRYAYEFYDDGNGEQERVKWKWRWHEVVQPARGGTGNAALEIWFFDLNGRIRLYGSGAGDAASNPPTPGNGGPFYITYAGYDAMGRLALQIEDFDPGLLTNPDSALLASDITDLNPDQYLQRRPEATLENPAENLITRSIYDNAGFLTSRRQGKTPPGNFSPDPDHTDHDAVRTDFRILNPKITYKEGQRTRIGWEDRHTYQMEYSFAGTTDHATVPAETVDVVHGTTTVRVFDGGGRFIEERIISSDPTWTNNRFGAENAQVRDFGWHVSLLDHTRDGGVNASNPVSSWYTGDAWDCTAQDCEDPNNPGDPQNLQLQTGVEPAYPGTDKWIGKTGTNSIITLARSFKKYTQASTLKPTKEIIYNDFSTLDDQGNFNEERAQVVKEFTYDMEDRIARKKEPDGTISRYLFDAKRRLAKVFRGSTDDCDDWFPPAPDGSGINTGQDDMLLVEQRLYNDGDATCEHSPWRGQESCTTKPCNDNFPNNAGKLVRTRRFTGNAEDCNTAYTPSTDSRDSQYLYDWRGRTVLAKEVAVGYGGGTAATPLLASATSVVFDNLDRPLLVATWSTGEPDVATIESWADLDTDDATIEILTSNPQPLTLSRTFYDERGRPYEQRSYNIDDSTGNSYTFTRTYRDDLNRVTAELSQNGLILNTYDPLGRRTKTSHWSREDSQAPGSADTTAGVELTRTVTDYDAFGNVKTQTHYDRLNTSETGAIDDDPATSNAVITYTHNWYDQAKRLIATANYGTHGDDGFTNVDTEDNKPVYDAAQPPTWTGSKYQINDADTSAIVTRYGYDRASRRIWSQDPRGIVTRTWYDLLGRTTLVAENWDDIENVAADQDTWDSLTHYGARPIRYTAYHYTRGGLQDMIVAVVPEDPSLSSTFAPHLTPDSFIWTEDAANDYAATGVTVPAGMERHATRYVYGADILNDRTHAAMDTSPAATAPNLVKQILYPDASGAPSDTDVVTFRYSLEGNPVQRTDQRGVVLDYTFGHPGGRLTNVHADISSATDVDNSFEFLDIYYQDEPDQRSFWAKQSSASIARESVVFLIHDGAGNLIEDRQIIDYSDSTQTRSLKYNWQHVKPSTVAGPLTHNRLLDIAIEEDGGVNSQVLTKFVYGAAGSAEDYINRKTAITDDLDQEFIQYEMTGGGRTKAKTWGPGTGVMKVDHQIAAFDSNDPEIPSYLAGTDPFGRITNLTFENHVPQAASALHRYEYGYDRSGNRLFVRIEQSADANKHSYLYSYDNFNRLRYAESGELSTTSSVISTPGAGEGDPTGRLWALDLLGNWSGVNAAAGSVFDYTPNNLIPGQQPSELTLRSEHHAVAPNNRITTRTVEGVNTNFNYDDTGNLTDDGTHTYTYDALKRLTQVHDKITGDWVAAFSYDALGRRILKSDSVNRDAANSFTPVDYYYYDGDRIVEVHRRVIAGDPLPGDYTIDDCSYSPPPPPPPPRGGEENKRITEAGSDQPNKDKTGKLPPSLFAKLVKDSPESSAKGTPNPGATDEQGQILKDVVASSPDKDQVRRSDTPTPTEVKLWRRFVYGLDYIDELVAQITPDTVDNPNSVRYVLQDANHNVVGITRACDGELIRQYRYTPYGRLTHAEDGDGAPLDATGPSPLESFHLFQGLWVDPLSANPLSTGLVLYNARAREYDPGTGRFLQNDPNGQALAIANALAMNGQTRAVFASLSASTQYADGLNLYQFVGSNPVNRIDPTGLRMADFDWVLETEDYEDELTGHKIATLGMLNEGARWASLGLQTASDIALSLIPGYGIVEAARAVSVIRSGRGGLMDYLTVGLGGISGAATLLKAAKTLGKSAKWFAAMKTGAKFAGRFKPYKRRYLRHNLKVLTGWNPGRGFEAHHVLPVKFESFFKTAGVKNIHKPIYGSWWEKTAHRSAAYAYNEEWRTFFRAGSKTRRDVLDFAKKLAHDYGFEVLFD